MSTQTPAAVQNENVHIHRGKGIDGVKADAPRPKFKMANQTPTVVQNENVQIHRGKGIDGVNVSVLKPENKARKDRKALADLSSVKKPPLSGTSKGLAPKEKSAVRSSETTKKVPWTDGLTDEDIKKCEEWAKEGIEQCHFTGNDMQKLEKDMLEESVRKEVDMVMSSLREWNRMAYDWGIPTAKEEEDYEDIGVITKLELEPLPELPPLPPRTRSLSTLGDEEAAEDPLLGSELDSFLPYFNYKFEPYKLKEEYED